MSIDPVSLLQGAQAVGKAAGAASGGTPSADTLLSQVRSDLAFGIDVNVAPVLGSSGGTSSAGGSNSVLMWLAIGVVVGGVALWALR